MSIVIYIAVMAGVTYLVRMIPFTAFRKQIKSRFIRSVLYYLPYAVLSAMTVPAIFYSTSYLASAIVGFVVAVILAYFKKSLLTVASSACGAVLLCELLIKYVIL